MRHQPPHCEQDRPVGYRGNDGATGDGNGDDGDLQDGLVQRYTYHDDGLIDRAIENLVTDLNTDLMWIRDPLLLTGLDDAGARQQESDRRNHDDTNVAGNVDLSIPLDWQTSIDRVNQLTYAGYHDWRMPNIIELESLSQPGRAGATLDPGIFPNVPIDATNKEAIIWWSSTTSAYDQDEARPGRDGAWYQTAALGSTNFGSATHRPAKSQPGYVRPVRNRLPQTENLLFLSEVRSSADFAQITLPSGRVDLIREGKFLLPLPNVEAPFSAAYQDVTTHPLHYEFLKAAFPRVFAGLTPEEYETQVAHRASRRYFAGGLKSFTDSEGRVVYGFDLYTDPTNDDELLTEAEMASLYEQLARSFRRRPLVYSPTRAAAVTLALSWTDPGFPIAFPTQIASPEYEAYNLAETYGVVRLLTLADLKTIAQTGGLSRQDIVIVDGAPTDLESVVAGIITGERQGELSHLNIRSARRGTPNAYIKENHKHFAPYAGQLVRLSITRGAYYVESEVSQSDAEAWWATHRPPTVPVRAFDAGYSGLDDFVTIGANDSAGLATTRVGGKAANLARLYTFLPEPYQIPGFAIPFHYYNNF
ncbi:DUF1566 domain-containing protein [Chloroflexi bacterium TSY]|nr:DUF1566 domain-containing protein [Chloroflexi bacterium TSY]